MKVLLTTPTYPPFNSGLGNAVARQAVQLAHRGVAVTVATGGTARRSRRVQNLQVEEFAVTGAQHLRNPIRGEVESYLSFLRTVPFDVIVMHAWQTWTTDLILREAATIAGRKVLYSHCISTNSLLPFNPVRALASYALWRPYWWSLAGKLRKLDAIVFLADGGDDDRFDDLGMARKVGLRTYTIPNIVEAAPSALLEAGDARNRIISVGSFTRAKGFDFVLEAYARSSARNVVPLILFGQAETGFVSTLREQGRRLGLKSGMVEYRYGVAGDELLSQYQQAKLFVSGSYTECQPLVLLDAMASGTPFVARATGCISRLPGGVAVRSPAAAADEITRLLGDGDSWAALAATGTLAAKTAYSSRRHADLMLAMLADLA